MVLGKAHCEGYHGLNDMIVIIIITIWHVLCGIHLPLRVLHVLTNLILIMTQPYDGETVITLIFAHEETEA